jgi:glutamate/tyrosine decarboxylase-like PLP-dependent enzyme
LTRALRFLGRGSGSLVPLATGTDARLEPAVLSAAMEKTPTVPTIVVLHAADLSVGAFDPFVELISLAKSGGAWVHVDGAFGLWAS